MHRIFGTFGNKSRKMELNDIAIKKRELKDIPIKYRPIFSEINQFNHVQSEVFDDVMKSSKFFLWLEKLWLFMNHL